ncbi:uncharacterized protein LOC129598936 [Paramacrobiotus metropolitanus]|uniref:uncharacterized protein LOC129598936 n=1 Tax=Paramacrobiotus metropolitanus TaxID=2943436 RepID=UPI0024460689|nr:uncharacterized protein LOC129598936 [Paramacrobiotus metropolitanus]
MGEMVVFLRIISDSPLTTEDLENLLSEAKSRLAPQSFSVMTPSPSPCRPTQEDSLQQLPRVLVNQILQVLDSAQRAHCRRVCSLWDGILEHHCVEVVVSFSHQRCVDDRGRPITPHEVEWRRSAYMVGWSLWQCVGTGTERIIISRASHQGYSNEVLADCLRLIEHIYQELPSNGKTLTLIVHKFHWDVDFLPNSGLDCGVPRVRVIWKDCTFSGPKELFHRHPIIYGVSPTGTTANGALGLYGVVEASLPDFEADLPRLSVWIAEAAREGAGSALRQRIDRVLHDCQGWYYDTGSCVIIPIRAIRSTWYG